MFCHYVSYEHFSELFALCTEKLAFITFMSICQTKTYVGTMYFHEIYHNISTKNTRKSIEKKYCLTRYDARDGEINPTASLPQF